MIKPVIGLPFRRWIYRAGMARVSLDFSSVIGACPVGTPPLCRNEGGERFRQFFRQLRPRDLGVNDSQATEGAGPSDPV